jgi:hypothetical protein
LVELEAVQFIRLMTVGRTGPFLAVAEDASGHGVEVVVKATNLPALGPEGLIREAIAAQVGRALGLPVPQAYAVRMGAAFLQSVAQADPALGARLSASLTVAFATAKLPPGYSAWSVNGTIPNGAQQQAEEILAFDLLLQNPDRRPINPNLQWNGTAFALFDHELALMPALFGGNPWDVNALDVPISIHIFGAPMRHRTPNLARLACEWAKLTDSELLAMESSLPAEWTAAAPSTASEVIALIRGVRDNFPACMAEVTRAMQ